MTKPLIFLSLFLCYSVLAKTVCTITLNSSEEKIVFQKELKNSSFKFVELVPDSSNLPKLSDDEAGETKNWFDEACENAEKNHLKCDVLLISGHFAGSFFGSSKKTLNLSKLEAKTCNNTCSGILKEPKAVYLFGCNTLAGKDLDSRTPQEYLQVLIGDGIPIMQAETIVDARYGATSSSNRDRMMRVFENSPRIYGFSSIGPSGQHVKNQIQNYFKKTPNYSQFISKLDNERKLKSVQAMLSSFNSSNGIRGDQFQCSLANTSVDCVDGLCQKDEKIQQLICSTQNEKSTLNQKLIALNKLLSRPDGINFLSTTNMLIDDDVYQRLFLSNDETKKSVEALRLNKTTIEVALTAIRSSSMLNSIRSDWIIASLHLGWITQEEADNLHYKMSKHLMGNFKDQTARDTLVALSEDSYEFHKGLQKNSKSEIMEFSKYLESTSADERLAALTVIKSVPTGDISTQTKIIENIYNGNKEISEMAAWDMVIMSPANFDLEQKIFPMLQDPNPARRINGITILGNSSSKETQLKILEMTNDKDVDVQRVARDVLQNTIKPADEVIKNRIFKIPKGPK